MLKMLENKINELNKLKGEEFTLLEMDNTIQDILYDRDDGDKSSIFDGETETFIETGDHSYTIWKNELHTLEREEENDYETVDINIIFEVLEKNEDNFEVVVRITDVELL